MLRTLFLIVIVLGLAAGGAWMAFVRHDRVAPPGEELLFDDFGFSVKDARRSKTASGSSWIVDLQVANHAQRVGYKLDNHQVVMVDEHGRMFTGIGSPPPVAELPHGESCITRFVFDVPDDTKDPRLKIRFGAIGSALDYVLFGDWSLALP